jgi:hypothetical protein
MYVGVDIGTTRIKAAAVSDRGILLGTSSVNASSDLHRPGSDLQYLLETIEGLLKTIQAAHDPISAIAVSAIAPSLVAFTRSGSIQTAFTHLTTSSIGPCRSANFDDRLGVSRIRSDERRTRYETQFGVPQCYLPLSTAIGFLLTGQLGFDVMTAYELGFTSISSLTAWCGADVLSDDPTRHRPLRLAATTTDSVASMLGCGATRVSDVMLYYGTYFCAAEIRCDLASVMKKDLIDEIPFLWLVSLPFYGPFLESEVRRLTGASTDAAFDEFGRALDRGAATPLRLARALISKRSGPFGFDEYTVSVEAAGEASTFDEHAAILAAPLGFALREVALRMTPEWSPRCYAAGGASRINGLVRLTSRLSGIDQEMLPGAWSCIGSASLARRSP